MPSRPRPLILMQIVVTGWADEVHSRLHCPGWTLARPKRDQSIYFLERESENVWRYYSIVQTGINANRMIAGNESSGSIEPLRSIATSSEFPPTGSQAVGLVVWLTAGPICVLFDECKVFPGLSP